MLKEGCLPVIKNCSGHFSKLVHPQVCNTLLMDIAHFIAPEEEANEPLEVTRKMTAILAGLYKALKNPFSEFKLKAMWGQSPEYLHTEWIDILYPHSCSLPISSLWLYHATWCTSDSTHLCLGLNPGASGDGADMLSHWAKPAYSQTRNTDLSTATPHCVAGSAALATDYLPHTQCILAMYF